VLGIPPLREAVAKKFKRENGLDYKASDTIVGTGGKHILSTPFWRRSILATRSSFPRPIGSATLKWWRSAADRRHGRDAHGGWFQTSAGDFGKGDHAKDQMAGAQLAVQPVGRGLWLRRDEKITDVLLRHPQVHVLTDDIYEHLVYGGFKFVTPAQVEPNLHDRTLTMNGVSKAYA